MTEEPAGGDDRKLAEDIAPGTKGAYWPDDPHSLRVLQRVLDRDDSYSEIVREGCYFWLEVIELLEAEEEWALDTENAMEVRAWLRQAVSDQIERENARARRDA